MSRYHENARRAEYSNTDPTETDQSQGHETDINVIVGKYGIGNVATGNDPAGAKYYDWTQFPTDLQGMIEMARTVELHRGRLPAELKEMPMDQILALTPEQLSNILTKPAKTQDTTPATGEEGKQ